MRARRARAWWLQRPASIAGLALALALTVEAAAAASVPHGSVQHVWVPAPSLHKTRRSVRIYLPPSYHDPAAARRRYPLILLLHGWPGGDGNWRGQGHAATTLDTMIAHHSIPEVIALMPNANGPGMHGRSRYIDPFDGSFDIQEFLTRDLIQWADRELRTIRDSTQRGIIGLSDGGSGAINLTLLHPEVFGAAGGLSGRYHPGHVWGDGRVLGPEPGASQRLAANSPWLYVPQKVESARRQSLFFATGESDGSLPDNIAFHARLDSLGIPHTFEQAPGGHSWKFWKRQLRDALIAVTRRMHTEG